MTSSGIAQAEGLDTPIAGLVELALGDPTFRDIRADIRPADDTGLALVAPTGARPFVAGALARGGPLLVVTATGREAAELTAELRGLFGDAVALFPSWETLPHERLSPGVETVGARLMMLRRLAHPDDGRLGPPLRVVVTTTRSLLQPMTPDLAHVEPVTLTAGTEIGFEDVIARLVELAYTRVDMVGKRGEFAVRGGILDVFPPTAEHPVRVEFWGDEISDMRMFSVADQRSIPELPVDTVVAVACRELLLTPEVKARAAALATPTPHQDTPGPGTVSEMLAKLAEGIPVDGMEALLPVLRRDDRSLLIDQLPAGTPLLVCDPEKVRTRAADLIKTGQEFLEASWSTAAMGGPDAQAPIDLAALGASGFLELDDVRARARHTSHPWWTLSPLSDGTAIELDIRPAPTARGHQHTIDEIFAMLRAHTATGGYAAIVTPGTGTAHRVVEQLKEADVPATMAQPAAIPQAGVVGVLKGTLHEGVVLPGTALVIITEADLTGNRVAITEGKRLAAKRRNTVDPLALTAGDLVVHDQHGIGRFVEMVERTVGGARREYLVLEYASSRRPEKQRSDKQTDKLYVPMDSLDQLSRYVGGQSPTLSRLGGSDWANTKTRARGAVREIASELVSLYAKRQASPGFAFGPDTPWQAEMEDAFGYTETVDQLTAITEVKADMEKPVPMDRVVCGDVGYGKTEIAVRAAFKAVQDGKQVAVLVPTTLLADQHLQTFTERMAGFPVGIKALSRFTDVADSRAVLDGMAEGSVDIVIGTHRLLQTGVRWKDLGLVVVDEEQRFGVEHKEHIKAMRTHVDVLTMSATPIPRTLEMSLAGIREMSTILTPPEERYPVLTYVGAHDDKQIAAALRRELLRDGQVFYVHNRVSSIDQAAARVRALVPEARVVVAHGQMNEDTLERTVEGVLEPRVRRSGLHHDRRDRPGHLERQHARRRARRHLRAGAAAPAARPGRAQPRARLRLLPVSTGPAADRNGLRPAGHDRAEQRAWCRHVGGDEGPRDPRRRQCARRRTVRPRRRRRLRPVRAAGRRGRRGLPRGRGRQNRRGARGTEGRAHRPAGRRASAAGLHRQRPVAVGGIPEVGCGRRRRGRSPRWSTSSPTAMGRCPSRRSGWSRSRGYVCCAASTASPRCRRRAPVPAPHFGCPRCRWPIPSKFASSGCTRARTTAPPPRPCRCRFRVRGPASVRRASATSNLFRWWPTWSRHCMKSPKPVLI